MGTGNQEGDVRVSRLRLTGSDVTHSARCSHYWSRGVYTTSGNIQQLHITGYAASLQAGSTVLHLFKYAPVGHAMAQAVKRRGLTAGVRVCCQVKPM
jgi:hypothetical protein